MDIPCFAFASAAAFSAENGIKSVKITDALKNVETIYNGGDYDKATEELSKIDTSNLTDAKSQKYQSLQTNIANAKAAAEKAAAEAKAKAKIDISMAKSKVIFTDFIPFSAVVFSSSNFFCSVGGSL